MLEASVSCVTACSDTQTSKMIDFIENLSVSPQCSDPGNSQKYQNTGYLPPPFFIKLHENFLCV